LDGETGGLAKGDLKGGLEGEGVARGFGEMMDGVLEGKTGGLVTGDS
jgi:hypothetical protein